MLQKRVSTTCAAVAVTVAAGAGLLTAGLASPPAAARARTGSTQPTVTTLRLVTRQDVFQFVDNPPSGDSAGDLIATSDKVYSRHSHAMLGRDHVTGIETVPAKSIALTNTVALARGEITLQGVTNEQNNRPATLAITGGTGTYTGAAGVAVLTPITRTTSDLTLSIRRR